MNISRLDVFCRKLNVFQRKMIFLLGNIECFPRKFRFYDRSSQTARQASKQGSQPASQPARQASKQGSQPASPASKQASQPASPASKQASKEASQPASQPGKQGRKPASQPSKQAAYIVWCVQSREVSAGLNLIPKSKVQ